MKMIAASLLLPVLAAAGPVRDDDAVIRALRHVSGRGPVLGLVPGDLEVLALRRGARSRHVDLRQLAGGIPVLGGTLSVHLADGGRVQGVTGRTFRVPRILPSRRISPFRAEGLARAALEGEGIAETGPARLSWLPAGEGARLVYECWVHAADPPGSFRVLIDAARGRVLEVKDCREPFDGLGRVFRPNPVVSLQDDTLRDQDDADSAVPESAYEEVPLRDLSGSGTPEDPYTLSGPHVTTQGTPDRARSVSGEFLFHRSDRRFEEVMVYFHIDSIQRYIQEIGFSDLCRRQIRVYVNSEPPGIPFPADKSYYSPDGQGTGVLVFGTGGVDSAEDAEIIAHEYGHAVLDYQVPGFGSSREAGSLKEGFCDFFSAAALSSTSGGRGDACIGEWKAASYQASCLRRLDTAKRYPYDMTYSDRYQDSEIWSGALWDLARAVGSDTALKIVLEGNYLLSPDATFPGAGEALILADRGLFDGAHRGAIEAVLRDRGILRPPLRLEGFVIHQEDPEIPIPDDNPLGLKSALEYPHDEPILSGLSLQVYVDIGHPFPPDLQVVLTSPAGTGVPLTPPWSFPTIYGSLDLPGEGDLASFAGERAGGTWQLRIVDSVALEEGVLRAWGIRVLNITRGETNDDGAVDLSDALKILFFLFRGDDLPCETRADTDDDGSVSITDVVYLLTYLYLGGPEPPPPFDAPGSDPTPDELACRG